MAHTLTATWYESSTSNYVTINDVKVDVPYELKNGDVIKIYSNNGDSTVMFLNGNRITDIWGTVINLSDTDILYEENEWGPIGPGDDPGPIVTINYTETSTPRKSVDLTTLPGWSSLSDGSHSITIVAKADGYRDSEPSAAVTVEKAAEVTLISFTIAGTSYQAEEGMTWAEWVESSYNTGNFALNGSYVWDRTGLYVSTQNSTASKYYVGINASIANGGTFYLASTEIGGSGK